MPIPEFSLEGKRAIVIAGSRGIGKGIALALAEAGADVAIASLNLASAQRASDEVRAMGRETAAYAVDVTKEASVKALADRAIDEFGPLEVIVNSPGELIRAAVAARPGRDEQVLTPQLWREYIDLDLTQAFLSCHYFGPHLLERRLGTVIQVSSAFGAFRVRPLLTVYDTAKAGLVQFTRGVALEWAPYGVTCNSIAPGNVPDPDQMDPADFEARSNAGAKQTPLGRVSNMREIGLLAVYMASDAARYMTGQVIAIDGGLTL